MKVLESAKAYHLKTDHKGSSFFKKISLSSLYHALSEPVETTDAMTLGSALHCAVLEPEKYSSEYAVAPKVDRRTKEGKEIFANFEKESEGKTVLTADQNEAVEGMKSSIMKHDIASAMLTGGEAEYSYYINHESGLGLKCRPDYFNKGALIDVKSCRDASVEGFTSACFNLGYFIQAAFYLDVFNAANNTNVQEFYFVAVENSAPYAVNTFKMGETEIAFGRDLYKRALGQYVEFLSNPVPSDFGYKKQINEIVFKPYMFEKMGAC